jgi:hypothetical protein
MMDGPPTVKSSNNELSASWPGLFTLVAGIHVFLQQSKTWMAGTSHTQRGITAVIPAKSNREIQRACDFALYCERNLVERFFNQLRHFRAVATR